MNFDKHLNFNFTTAFKQNYSLKRKITLGGFFVLFSLFNLYTLFNFNYLNTKNTPEIIYFQTDNLKLINDTSSQFVDYFFNNSINASFDFNANKITNLSINNDKKYYLHSTQDKLMKEAIYSLIYDKSNALIEAKQISFINHLTSFEITNVYDVDNQKGVLIKVKYSQSYNIHDDNFTVDKESLVFLKLNSDNKILDYFIV